MTITRRAMIATLAVTALPMVGTSGHANVPKILVTKDPNCGCCTGWTEHLKAAGFDVHVSESADLGALKNRLGVPADLHSCHTAEIEGYVIEGHVPAVAVRRLLADRPAATGLSVPGMPVGSPGMEIEGQAPEDYAVILFGSFGRRTFGRFREAAELPG